MAYQNSSSLAEKIKKDGVLDPQRDVGMSVFSGSIGGGAGGQGVIGNPFAGPTTQDGIALSQQSTFNNLRGGGAPVQDPMQAGMPVQGQGGVLSEQPTSMPAMNKQMLAQARLFTPTAPPPDIFVSGMAPGQTNPVHAYAPTDLRARTLAEGGQGVWGQGDVMAFSDGQNAQGGQKFSLGQVMPVGGPNGGPVTPQNPIAPETLQPATAGAPGTFNKSPIAGLMAAFGQNSMAGKYIAAQAANRLPIDNDHLKMVAAHDLATQKAGITTDKAKQVAEGNAAAFAPDLAQNNGVQTAFDTVAEAQTRLQAGLDHGLPIGTITKLSANVDAAKKQVAMDRASADETKNVIDTIDRMLPKLDQFGTTGVVGSVMRHVSGSDATDLSADADKVRANLSLNKISEMRNAAKGGSPGMVIRTQREFDAAAAARANMDVNQSATQQKQNLLKLRTSLYNAINPVPDNLVFKSESDYNDAEVRGAVKPGNRVIVGGRYAIVK